jgi:hypothetical protein
MTLHPPSKVSSEHELIASEEHGQASVHVNLSATLAARYSKEADVHLLSFDGLRSRCPTNVTFHAFEGVGLSKLYMEKWRALNPGKRPCMSPLPAC